MLSPRTPSLPLPVNSPANAIKQLVATSKDEVALGVERVQQLVTLLASLVRRFSEIAGQVDRIASGSDTAVDAIHRITEAMAVLDRTMQQKPAMAEEASVASHELLRNADDLNHEVARFSRSESPSPTQLAYAA